MKILKWIGYALGGLVALLVLCIGTIYALSEMRFRRSYAVTPSPVAVSNDSATLQRGEHLVAAITKCVECHGEHFEGRAMINAPPMGRLVALNLTSGHPATTSI